MREFKIEKVSNMIFITKEEQIFKAWDEEEFTEKKLQNAMNYMDGMFGIEQDEISGWQIRTFGMKTKASAIKYSFGRELIEYSL